MAILIILAVALTAAAQTPRSVWDGVYTQEQAGRGKALMQNNAPVAMAPIWAGALRRPHSPATSSWLNGKLIPSMNSSRMFASRCRQIGREH